MMIDNNWTYRGSVTLGCCDIFQAYPSDANQLCTVVEYIMSLNHIFMVQGLTDFSDRAERATYNALPAEITPDMWAHQYIQQNNEINSQHQDTHIWETDGPDSNVFGLEPNFGCCTANYVQGWPKMVTNSILLTQDNGIAISQYAPMSATFPTDVGGGAEVSVVTDYPFADTVSIKVEVKSATKVPVYLRVPAWATTGTVTVNGGASQSLHAGTMQQIMCGSGITQIDIDFKPVIRLEFGWGYTNSVAVVRGPLVYALYLQENFKVTKHYQFNSNDYTITTPSVWNYALLIDEKNPGNTLTFQRNSTPGAIPFNNQGFSQVIHAKGRQLPSWGLEANSAGQPPQSPVVCSASETSTYPSNSIACGPVADLLLVPFGCTDLRMGSFPWISSS